MSSAPSRAQVVLAVLIGFSFVPGTRTGVLLSRIEARGPGEVRSAAFLPGSTRLVFSADREADAEVQLYTASADGSSSPSALDGSPAGYFECSPDGAWLVFGNPLGIHVQALVGGGAPALLAAGAAGFGITPDSTRVVFSLSTSAELFVVPIDGSAPPALLVGLSAPSVIASYAISPDSSRVLLALAQTPETSTVKALASVALAGGPLVGLTPPLPPDRQRIGSFQIDPASSRAVYTLDEFGTTPEGWPYSSTHELISVALDGSSAPVRLNEHGTPDAELEGFVALDPAGTVVFLGLASFSSPIQLYHVPIDASAPPLPLNPALQAGGGVVAATLAPDGSRVAFVARIGASTIQQLYSAPPDGSAPAVLLSGGDQVLGLAPVLSPDSQRAVYLTNPEALHIVRLDGSAAPVPLISGLVPTQDLIWSSPAFSADGSRVLVRGDLDTDQVYELYSVPLGGGAVVRLNDPLAPGGQVQSIVLPASGDEVAFLVQAAAGAPIELHATTVDGASPPVDVSQFGAGPVAGDVRSFVGCAGRAIYRADQLVDERLELFSAPLEGTAEPVRLHAEPPAGGDVQEFHCSAAAGRVVFRGDVRVDGRDELFTAPLDGSVPSVLLHPALASGRNVTSFALAPDGSRVLYVADPNADNLFRLFSVPIDASAAPVTVNGALVTGGDVLAFAVDEASTRVVYRADQTTDQVIELYARPLGLGSPAVRLNATLVAGGDVDAFALAPSGTRAVYRADQALNDVFELFGVPADASAPPVRLSPTLPAGGDVQDFAIDPSGARVVFRVDAQVDEVFELYSAPLDGSAPAVRLSPALVVDGDVNDFRIDPLGLRVVLRADAFVDQTFALFSAPLAGGAPATLLQQEQVPQGVLPSYHIDPTARHVVYFERVPGEDAWALFQRPIDGSGPAVRLSPAGRPVGGTPVFLDGDVLYVLGQDLVRTALHGGPSFRLSQTFAPWGGVWASPTPLVLEGRVLYAAAESPGILQLFASALTPPVRRR